jgi:hypothetical protein
MRRFDDELQYACAWGRWRIDPARNDAALPPASESRPIAPRDRVVVHAARSTVRRGRARLRLVGSGTPSGQGATR